MIVYKLVRKLKDNSLAPLFINRTFRFTFNEWLKAELHPTKGFQPREGWHCTLTPTAPHLSTKDRVWIELEVNRYELYTRPKSQGGVWVLAPEIKVIRELTYKQVLDMISQKQSKTIHKKADIKKLKNELEIAKAQEIEGKTVVQQVNNIDPAIAKSLETFLNHKPFFEFFKDAAIAMSKTSEEKELKPEDVNEIKDCIPYIFTAKDKEVAFSLVELQLLFHLFSASTTWLSDPNHQDKHAAAVKFLETSNIDVLHQYIKQLKTNNDRLPESKNSK